MEYVRLGLSGLKVSKVCLGTMTFGREADEKTSYGIMDYYRERGGIFLDTADGYSGGMSEEIVGCWIRDRGVRNDVVLATKVYARMGTGPNEAGLSRAHIVKACEDSLRRLGTDHIDLYQIHRWDPEAPPHETIRALDDLVRQGKILYAGCSNLKAWHLSEFVKIADSANLACFASIQPIYNALNRGIESEILPYCALKGIGVIVYNPLGGGMLTGKYRKGEPLPKGARIEKDSNYNARYYTDTAMDIVEDFITEAGKRGVSPAQLALAWAVGEPRVSCPIVGARNVGQLEDTLGGLAIRLTPEERAAVPAVLPGRWVGLDPVYDRAE